MVQGVDVLTIKPDDLSFIPRTNAVEGKLTVKSVSLVHTHHVILKIKKKSSLLIEAGSNNDLQALSTNVLKAVCQAQHIYLTKEEKLFSHWASPDTGFCPD